MKTSNYIIIAFFTFLFGGIFVLFLTASIHSKTNEYRNWTYEEKKLDPFHVVVAEPGANFILQIESHEPVFRCIHPPKEAWTFPPFTVRNDTLFISSAKENQQREPTVTARNIKSLIAKERSYTTLYDIKADTLSIRLLNAVSDVHFIKENNRVSLLSIHATESRINLYGAHSDNVDIQLSKTRVEAWGNPTGYLSGVLKNHSSLSLGKIKKINLEADSTSTYRLEK